ncbi:MAG: head-tail connector protein [Bacillota bacterium]
MADLVTLAEAKPLLGSPDADDALVSSLITRASAGVERYTGRQFVRAEATDYLDGGHASLLLTRRPVSAVASVTDQETNAVIDSALYVLYPEEGRVQLRGGVWSEGPRRWKVVYTPGYAAVPGDVKEATLMLIAAWYNRPDQGLSAERIGDYQRTAEAGMPTSVRELLAPYREVVV